MAFNPDNLKLTDFLDVQTLQEIQDNFAAVANVRATIADADGQVITQPAPTREYQQRQRAIAQAEEVDVETREAEGPQKEGREYVAPIMVNNQRLGTIRMAPNAATFGLEEAKVQQLAEKYGLDLKQLRGLLTSLSRAKNTRPAAIQFLFLLANALARMCYQEFQLRQRIHELTALYNVTMLLAEPRDLQKLLQRTVQVVAEVMNVKASSIRLIDEEGDELVIKAVHNLSPEYVNKGMIRLSRAEIDKIALSPRGYELVQDMATDPRVHYPEQAQREGIKSMLSVGMRYRGKPIGVLRVYTDETKAFTGSEIDLLRAIAAQAAAAIENARLLAESIEADALEKQVRMAADVQQRMLPATPPAVPGLELASVYVPCFELGGDFYDFIPLPYDNMGLVVADVSGKGVPASLIMASVRAALRAQVDNVFYLYEVMGRLNMMLCRDTKPTEFVTLFYGVLDAPNRRLTYCNAGHPPPLLLRDGLIQELGSDNLVLGVSPEEAYAQHVADLKSGDYLLIYSDGLSDAMNFGRETFGRQRILESFIAGAGTPGASAESIAQHILWEMRRFIGLNKRTDDVTLLVVRVK